MSVFYRDMEAKCPFYIKGSNNSIQCEGCSCTSIKLLFNDSKGLALKEERDKYSMMYCENRYEDCKFYKIINSKYEGEEQ